MTPSRPRGTWVPDQTSSGLGMRQENRVSGSVDCFLWLWVSCKRGRSGGRWPVRKLWEGALGSVKRALPSEAINPSRSSVPQAGARRGRKASPPGKRQLLAGVRRGTGSAGESGFPGPPRACHETMIRLRKDAHPVFAGGTAGWASGRGLGWAFRTFRSGKPKQFWFVSRQNVKEGSFYVKEGSRLANSALTDPRRTSTKSRAPSLHLPRHCLHGGFISPHGPKLAAVAP